MTVLYLLPGLLCDATVWRHQEASLLAAGIDVRIADFRGYDSLTDMAKQVLAKAPERFALAGHSMGARVALEAMRLEPGRIERLALLDTGVHPKAPGEADKRQILLDLAHNHGMAALAKTWLPPMVHPDRLGDDALMRPLYAMVEGKTPAIFTNQVRALLNRPDAAAGLSAITCPVLIGVGRQDSWSPVAQHEAMAKDIPHAELVVFEESGHMAPAEVPEAVTAALVKWLGF